MADQKKLDRWADKLLDTGKRNNLINFRETKTSTAEILYPDCEAIFSRCSVGHVFEVFDPHIPDMEKDDQEQADEDTEVKTNTDKGLTRDEYKTKYLPRIKSEKYLLAYARMPDPMSAIKSIAKKAKGMQDETGINVAYLAFGFLKWNEKEGSEVYLIERTRLINLRRITSLILFIRIYKIIQNAVSVSLHFLCLSRI